MYIKTFFEIHNRVVVALSGGVDSAVLLMLAKRYADDVFACFVKSELQPEFELADARAVCDFLNVDLKIIELSLLSDSNVAENSKDRCYFCKSLMFNAICDYANELGAEAVEGTNSSDDVIERAGYKAIGELGVLSPLRECGIGKSDIRSIAAENNIPVHSKPSYACLATRIPSDVRITEDILKKTESAEKELFALGFNDFRIRYNHGCALLELSVVDRERYVCDKENIDKLLLKYYYNITLSEKVR